MESNAGQTGRTGRIIWSIVPPGPVEQRGGCGGGCRAAFVGGLKTLELPGPNQERMARGGPHGPQGAALGWTSKTPPQDSRVRSRRGAAPLAPEGTP